MPKHRDKSLIRSKMLQARFSPIEMEMIRSKAQDTGMSLGELTRRCLLLRPIPPPPPRLSKITLATYRELSRIGNNINQLTKATNTAILRGLPPPADPEQLNQLYELLQQIGRELILSETETDDEDEIDNDLEEEWSGQ